MKDLRPKPELKADYLASLLTGIQRELLQLVEIAGHGTCSLRTDSWEKFELPLPPLRDQEVIGAFLKTELMTVTTAISRLEREIALLREYRTRLVADKLNVRPAARHLPAEPPAPAPEPEESPETEAEEPEA